MSLQPIVRESLLPMVLSLTMGVGCATSFGQNTGAVGVEKKASRDGLRLVASVPERAEPGKPLRVLLAFSIGSIGGRFTVQSGFNRGTLY